jgi:NAD dependent epimerase/dehydratase family enzyme
LKVLIADGRGFLGSALSQSLLADDHQVVILTRGVADAPGHIHWDGRTTEGWGDLVNEVDAVVNLSGHGLEHWPWTSRQKKRFLDSRVLPGRALASAIENASRRPGIFLQTSGINRYGLRGDSTADESTPPGNDFLAQLTVDWANATQRVEGDNSFSRRSDASKGIISSHRPAIKVVLRQQVCRGHADFQLDSPG